MSTTLAPDAQTLQRRRERVGASLADAGRAGLVVTTLVNVRYLTGFTGSNGALVLRADGSGLFLTDGRYRDQAAAEVPGLEHTITRDLLGVAGPRLADAGGAWAVETHTLSVDAHATLRDAAPGVDLVAADRVVERARETKDDVEVAALREACRISAAALEALWAGAAGGTDRARRRPRPRVAHARPRRRGRRLRDHPRLGPEHRRAAPSPDRPGAAAR
ncbi:MAG: aminopeptidase P family N-terminal domain-containing protein [Aeromicrobium erythreum]